MNTRQTLSSFLERHHKMNSMEMCKPILSVPFLLKVVPSNAYIAYENYSFTSLQIHAFSG